MGIGWQDATIGAAVCRLDNVLLSGTRLPSQRHCDRAAAPWEPGRPSVLIARTVEGHGLPFLAGWATSHYVTLSERNHARAIGALRTREHQGYSTTPAY
jgi:hypothetical protein